MVGGGVRLRPRALHLVDIDNLLGDPVTADARLIARTVASYRSLADVSPGDHVVVASSPSPRHALAVRVAWPGVSHHWRGGVDGADLVLLDVARWAIEVDRFARLVIGSGDRIFLCALEWCEACGMAVEVVSRRASLALALRTRARVVRLLPEPAPHAA